MNTIVGNDVAYYQGDIDFNTYKNNSNFIIIKASEGNGYKDPKLDRNRSEARRVGLARGYYHFARPNLGNTPEAEADWFIQCCGPLVEGEVLVLDFEVAYNDGPLWCFKFLDRVYSKTKCRPLVYLNQSQVNQKNASGGYQWKTVCDAGYGLWIAAYTGSPNDNTFVTGPWKFAAMQQWTDKQKVPGIPSAAVDGDVFFGDVGTFRKYGYLYQPEPDPCAEVRKELADTKASLQKLQDKMNQIKSIIS